MLELELHSKRSHERMQTVELNSYDHLPPELILAEAVAETQVLGKSMCAVLPLCWQEFPGEQEGERILWQVQAQGQWQGQEQEQGLALVLGQESPLWWGLQQVWTDYFQHTEACPGWLLPSVGTKEDSWG